MAPGPGQRRDGRHRDVIAEDYRRGAGAAAAAVEDDVVDTHSQRRVDVVFYVLGRHFHADRDAAGGGAHVVGKAPEVVLVAQMLERGRRDGRGARLETPHLGDLALHLHAG